MPKLTALEIFAPFIGKSVNRESFARCAHKNRETKEGTEYIVYICGLIYNKELCEMFGITGSLRETWERSGTDFNLYITIEGDTITKIRIDKYREVGANARPVIRPLKETQQELRIARRVLGYITTV